MKALVVQATTQVAAAHAHPGGPAHLVLLGVVVVVAVAIFAVNRVNKRRVIRGESAKAQEREGNELSPESRRPPDEDMSSTSNEP